MKFRPYFNWIHFYLLFITTGVLLITSMYIYIVFYLNHMNFALGIRLLEHFKFCLLCLSKRVSHSAQNNSSWYMNLMVSDWFLHMTEVSHHCLRIHWMRVSESHWSVLESCNSLGSRLSGRNWWPLQHLITYEWFVTVTWPLVPVAVALEVYWRTELIFCCNIFLNGNLFCVHMVQTKSVLNVWLQVGVH